MRSIGYLFIMILVASVSACHAGDPPVREAFLQFHNNGGGFTGNGPMADPGGDDGQAVPHDGPKAPSAVTDGPAAVPATTPPALVTPPDDSTGRTCVEDQECGEGFVCQAGICERKVVYQVYFEERRWEMSELNNPSQALPYEQGDEDSRTVEVSGTIGYQQYGEVELGSGSPPLEVVEELESASLKNDQMKLVLSAPSSTQWHVGDEPFTVTYKKDEPPPIDLSVENGSGVYEWKVDDEIRCPSCSQMPLIAAFPLPDGKASVPLTITDTVSGNSTEVLLFVVRDDQVDTDIDVDNPDEEDSDGDGTGDACGQG